MTRSADGSVVDTMRISIDIKGQHVTGRMDWLPGAKDRLTGTLEGDVKGDLLYLFHRYMAEGSTTIEQRVFRLGQHELVQLDGETLQMESGWELKDPAHAVEGMHVPEVACN